MQGWAEWLQTAMAYAVVAECPTGCDECQYDTNGVGTCKQTGCQSGYFYALDKQCVGQSIMRRFS